MHPSPATCCVVSGSGAIPGNLLRFDATIKLSSTVNRTLFAQDAVKGIVMGEAANRTSYQPIDIAQLPYSAKPPACAHKGTYGAQQGHLKAFLICDQVLIVVAYLWNNGALFLECTGLAA